MSDTFEQKSSLHYESYNDISKPVLIDGLLIHDPKSRFGVPEIEKKALDKVADVTVKEGYSDAELRDLYNTITQNNSIKRKYDMDTEITYPPNHPHYKPTTKDIIMNDTNDIMNQQYNTLLMTVAATASLGIIVFMLTSNTSSSTSS